MSVSSKDARRLIGILAGLGIVSFAGIADAEGVQVNTGILLIKQSTNGKVSRGTGAGILMPRLERLANDQLMAIWMDSAPDSTVPHSNANDNNGYWEGKTAIIQMSATEAPKVTSVQQMTDFTGDRPFNHPRLAAPRDANGNPGNYVVVNFASTLDDPNITNQYVMVLDATGKAVTKPLDVGQHDGNNHGAAEMHFLGSSNGVDHFVGGYLHNNNDSYAFGVDVTVDAAGAYTVKKTWENLFTRPANIGRPTIAVTAPDRITACAAKGNNRPPEDGIQCAVINATNGQTIAKQIVAPSKPTQKVYMNQPTIAPLGNGLCALGVVMSDGQGRNNNGHFKGSNTSMAYTIDCNTLAIKDTQMAVAPFQRHAVLTNTLYGSQGQTFVGSLGCSSTSAGGAGLQLIGIDTVGKMTVDKVNNLLPVMWQCDTAWLSYKGLRNPNNQGRDFLHTVGSVPNPGYQNPNGWMPEVSHFAVSLVPAPFDGNATRNSVFASFVPIAWDPAVQVIMGTTLDVSQIASGPSPTVGGGSTPTVGGIDPTVNGGATNGGVAAPTGGTTGGGSQEPHQVYQGSSESGGCNVNGAGAGGAPEGLGLAAVGLGLVAASRRRRAGR
jgi:MYXO-CTERM domain-containing protein